MCLSRSCIWYIFLFLMLQQPPRTTRTDPPFPTRRPSDRVLDRPLRLDIADDAVAGQLRRIADLLETALLRQDDMRTLQHSMVGALRTIHAVQRQQDRPDGDDETDETRAAIEHALAVVEEGQQALSQRLNHLADDRKSVV